MWECDYFALTFPNGGLLEGSPKKALMQVWELFQFAHDVVIFLSTFSELKFDSYQPQDWCQTPICGIWGGWLVHQKVMQKGKLKIGRPWGSGILCELIELLLCQSWSHFIWGTNCNQLIRGYFWLWSCICRNFLDTWNPYGSPYFGRFDVFPIKWCRSTYPN